MPVECLYMPMHTCTWEMICCESSLQEYGIPWHWGQNRFPLPSDKMINLLFFGMSNSDYEQLKQYIRACKITAWDFSIGKKKKRKQTKPPPLTATAEQNGSCVPDDLCMFFFPWKPSSDLVASAGGSTAFKQKRH